MILGFSQVINKKPSYFVEKISKGIAGFTPAVADLAIKAAYSFNWDVYSECSPKIHTAREDKAARWRAGMNIQAVIHNRTSRRCQFIPNKPCVTTQRMKVHYWYNSATELFDVPAVYIDGRELTSTEIDTLAVNDGFANRGEFFEYFNTDWLGTLIHWTNLKY